MPEERRRAVTPAPSVSEVIRTAIAERIEKRRGDLTGQSWSIGSGLKV
jgi:hypothetical protein